MNERIQIQSTITSYLCTVYSNDSGALGFMEVIIMLDVCWYIITIKKASQNKSNDIPYSTKFWRGKTLANRSFQIFGEENVGEFTLTNFSYFSKSGILLGKILASDICFVKFVKVSPAKILHYTLQDNRQTYLFCDAGKQVSIDYNRGEGVASSMISPLM